MTDEWRVQVAGVTLAAHVGADTVPETLQLTFPAALPVGTWDVEIRSPAGRLLVLSQALTVSTELGPLSGNPDASIGAPRPDDSASPPPADASVPPAPSPSDASVCTDCVPCSVPSASTPVLVSSLPASGWLFGPNLSADGSVLAFGWVLGVTESIWMARRAPGTLDFEPAYEPVGINTAGSNGTPFQSVDGRALYFYSTRSSVTNDRNLWRAERSTADPTVFDSVTPLTAINSSELDHLPALDQGQRTLYFTSTRPGGAGGEDLWVAHFDDALQAFTNATPIAELNTPASEASPAISPDGLTIYFATTRAGGLGDQDLWVATRPSTEAAFNTPQPLGGANSGGFDINPFITSDRRELFFSSNRNGIAQIWHALLTCP